MEECRAKYKAEFAENRARGVGMINWVVYQETKCGRTTETSYLSLITVPTLVSPSCCLHR